jgi:hypothetical protein
MLPHPEPGGYLQWPEMDASNFEAKTPDPAVSMEFCSQLVNLFKMLQKLSKLDSR